MKRFWQALRRILSTFSDWFVTDYPDYHCKPENFGHTALTDDEPIEVTPEAKQCEARTTRGARCTYRPRSMRSPVEGRSLIAVCGVHGRTDTVEQFDESRHETDNQHEESHA
jgi:hypothetical protein